MSWILQIFIYRTMNLKIIQIECTLNLLKGAIVDKQAPVWPILFVYYF